MKLSRLGLLACLALVVASLPTPVLAQASLVRGRGGASAVVGTSLPRNADGSTAFVDLTGAFPVGLRFYGGTYTGLYVNNNGNVSFAGPLSTYTPDAFPVASRPMIAPWWGDVDTRGTGLVPAERNLVYYDIQPGVFTATWYDVGYFASHTNLINSFQLILTDASIFGVAGSFDVEFRYNRCEWTTGDASGGSGGLGGTPASAGFDAGDDTNYLTLPGSRTDAIVGVCRSSNVGESGVWRFQVRPMGVTTCGNAIRELGEDCDDGNVANGDGCNDRCATERGPGSPCTDDLQCRTGFCTDGVCCGTRCDGQCEACNEAGSAGTCTAVSGAPRGARTGCTLAGTTCGGTCNGTDRLACRFPPWWTSCEDGAFCTTADRGSGAGACAGVARVCDDGLACTADSCDEAADRCATTPRPAGTACDDSSRCTTMDRCNGAGLCAGTTVTCPDDGLACTTHACSPATGVCGATVVAGCLIGGACIADGALDPANPCAACDPRVSRTAYSPVVAGTRCSELSCSAGVVTPAGLCDGAGACVVGPPMTCPSRECDGPMCRGACGSDADCTRPTWCDTTTGACTPDLPNGDPCARRGMCISDLCVDGVCCGDRCTGVCESCDLPGVEGRCSPYAAGTDPENECPGMRMCDGEGKCEMDDAAVVRTDAAVAPGDDAAMAMDDAALETRDAAVVADDASAGGMDAGAAPDAAALRGALAGGACGCRVAGRGGNPAGVSSLLLARGLATAGRRRRAGSSTRGSSTRGPTTRGATTRGPTAGGR